MNEEILKHVQLGDYLLVRARYPDCTNYEGEKIMVYKDTTIDQLIKQNTLDPHFSNNTKYHSPVARFEPTERGEAMAVHFMTAMTVFGPVCKY